MSGPASSRGEVGTAHKAQISVFIHGDLGLVRLAVKDKEGVPMDRAPKRVGACGHFGVIGGDVQVLGHDMADDVELALTLFGQCGVVGVASRMSEHQCKYAGLGAGEVDIGLSQCDDPVEIAGPMRIGGGLHRGTHPVHRLQHHAVQDFIAILEVLVGGGGADTGPSAGFGDRKSVGAVFFDKLPDSFKQLILEMSVVVIFLYFNQGFALSKLGSLTFSFD
jgi:hypothetical protein